MKLKRKVEFTNQHLDRSDSSASQVLNDLQHLTYGWMKNGKHLKASVQKEYESAEKCCKRQKRNMERTLHESQIRAKEEEGSGSTQLHDDIGFPNLSDTAQLLLGHNMIMVRLERTVGTKTNEKESLVIGRSTGTTVFKMMMNLKNLEELKRLQSPSFPSGIVLCMIHKGMLILQQ